MYQKALTVGYIFLMWLNVAMYAIYQSDASIVLFVAFAAVACLSFAVTVLDRD